MLYRHLKTGNLYELMHIAIDATNARNGTLIAIYRPYHVELHSKIYVRDWIEFIEKFEEVKR